MNKINELFNTTEELFNSSEEFNPRIEEELVKKTLETIYESDTFDFPYLNENVHEYNDGLINPILEHYANIADGYKDFFSKNLELKNKIFSNFPSSNSSIFFKIYTNIKNNLNIANIKNNLNIANIKNNLSIANIKNNLSIANIKNNLTIANIKNNLSIANIKNNLSIANIKNNLSIANIKNNLKNNLSISIFICFFLFFGSLLLLYYLNINSKQSDNKQSDNKQPDNNEKKGSINTKRWETYVHDILEYLLDTFLVLQLILYVSFDQIKSYFEGTI